MTRISEQGFTLAEAAEQLRVPKKTLRHVLTRPDRKARLLREYRNTKKGLITVEIIPQDLLDELSATLRTVAAPPDEEVAEPNDEAIGDTSLGEPSSETSAQADAPAQEDAPSAPDDVDEPSTSVVAAPSINVSTSLLDTSQSGPGDARLIVATYERLLSEKDSRLSDLRAALDAERENGRRLAEALAREQETLASMTQRLAQAAQDSSQPRSWFARLFGGR
ncbi:MAG: hypothetical protein P4L33_04915 [Capsulimonadaceae bacterium]|nr:hypothetical protein [Capsulimonadaceae bacterium]